MRIDLTATNALTEAERVELRQLTLAVYPPESAVPEPDPIVWAPPQWHIRVRDDAGQLVTHVGLLTRTVLRDGASVRIGGIGGVQTRPGARGRGYASAGMERAQAFFIDEAVPFALLGCPVKRVSFYESLGWQLFRGILTVAQPGGTVRFTHNQAMVRTVLGAAPTNGALDLRGLPW